MRFCAKSLLIVLSILVTNHRGEGQTPITVAKTVNGVTTTSSFAANAPVAVDVGTITTDVIVHIWDSDSSGGLPQHSVGAITITGHYGGALGRVSLLIGGWPHLRARSGAMRRATTFAVPP